MKLVTLLKTLTILTLVLMSKVNAQEKDRLFEELKQKDQLLFENTFGRCNIDTIDSLIGDDFEFYHDKGGYTASKTAFMKQLKNGNCAPKKDKSAYQSFRVLHEDTLEVFPLYDKDILYAVIQTGVHSFYESNHGSNLTRGSTAKFSHLWVLKNKDWQLKRVLSYDHQSPLPWKH